VEFQVYARWQIEEFFNSPTCEDSWILGSIRENWSSEIKAEDESF
jgi:hypothetical protein